LVKNTTRDALPKTTPVTGRNSLVAVPEQATVVSPARKTRLGLFAGAFFALALGLMWWGFGGGGAPAVLVETLVPGPVRRVLAVSGRTATDVRSDIVSSVSARVLSVNALEGDIVEVGAPLVDLDDTQQQTAVRQVLAALDAAILTQQSAAADRDRAMALRETISSVALADADQALALAALEVDRQRAALDQARLRLPDYRITAPIGGVVLSRSVELGDLVTPTNILMRLAKLDGLHVEVQVDEIYTSAIRVGQTAQLQLAGRSDVMAGKVAFVASEVDEVTGSMRVKLSFDTPPEAQIGLTTVANILIDEAAATLTVPRRAFVEDGAGMAVFVLRDGRASLTPITYIDWPAERVEVISGLATGDKVIVSVEGIKDGQLLAEKDTPTTMD